MHKDICYLGNAEETQNEYGDVVYSILYSSQYQFVNVKSVGYREFYEAHSTGFKPDIVIEMNVFSYTGQKYVKYNDTEYRVIRTYQKGTDKIELILERGVNVCS